MTICKSGTIRYTDALKERSDGLLTPSPPSLPNSPELVVATQEVEEHASQEAPTDLIIPVEPEKTPAPATNDALEITKKPGGAVEAGEVEQCPITLLTGFLGSGKTTLLE